jgi:hypothetical protein
MMESIDNTVTYLCVGGRDLGKAMRAGLLGTAVGAGAGMMSIGQVTQLPDSAWTSLEPRPLGLEDQRHSTVKRRNVRAHRSCEYAESASAVSCGPSPDPDGTSPCDWTLSRDEIDKRFAALVKARSPRRSQEFSLLVSLAEASEILDVALKQYDQYGYEGRLSLAADLLSEMGDEGWRVMRGFCETNRPECYYFVDAVAAFRGVRRAQRIGALKQLASNPDPEVRAAVLNSQRYRPDCFDASILDELRNKGDEDEREEINRLVDSYWSRAPVT